MHFQLKDKKPSYLFFLSQTSVLGLGLGVDFTFAGDYHKNHNHKNDKNDKNNNNPHLNFMKWTRGRDKGQGIRDIG